MEDPALFSGKLRPLKLERNYAVGDSSKCFEFSGSEVGRTRTVDPSNRTRYSPRRCWEKDSGHDGGAV